MPLRGEEPARDPESLDPKSAGPSSRRRDALAGLRLLVVEDEPDTLELLKEALTRYGAEVQTARDAASALEVFEGARPDVLITDVGMPGVDGYELVRRVRALGGARGGDVKAVALAAYAREEARGRALAAGFHEHVTKPVNPDALAAVVAALTGRA